MHFGVDIGHNCPPADTGAVGIKREDTLVFEVGNRVIERLVALGHTCTAVCPRKAVSVAESLFKRCRSCNNAKVDVAVSIHFNASASHLGRGCEVYWISSKGRFFAENVQNELVKLGFRDRETKRGNFYFLRNTNAPAILIEPIWELDPKWVL